MTYADLWVITSHKSIRYVFIKTHGELELFHSYREERGVRQEKKEIFALFAGFAIYSLTLRKS